MYCSEMPLQAAQSMCKAKLVRDLQDFTRTVPLARSCIEAEETLSCEDSYSLWNALIKQASLEEVKW